jgi:acetate kinase
MQRFHTRLSSASAPADGKKLRGMVTGTNSKFILTVNRGSSTLKCGVFGADGDVSLVFSAGTEAAGAASKLKIAAADGAALLEKEVGGDSNAGLDAIVEWMRGRGLVAQVRAFGHRVVQGGPQHLAPERITAESLEDIAQWVPLDPDHLPGAIEGMRYFADKFPGVPQVACFDTQFHRDLPEVARRYALPKDLYQAGVVRYGFHGLSYEYVMSELQRTDADIADGRVIIAHLGSGASMVAVRGGRSVDTSMGFTPLEGLIMSTRSGDVDAGAVLYLMESRNISAIGMSDWLNKKSGLLGISGISADMRVLTAKMAEDGDCAVAVEMFCYRAKKYIGAYAAALGGLDALVFTGGIGEHAAVVRKKICEGLEFLGIRLDAAKNRENAPVASVEDGRVRVRVVKTDEDLMIARHVRAVLGEGLANRK